VKIFPFLVSKTPVLSEPLFEKYKRNHFDFTSRFYPLEEKKKTCDFALYHKPTTTKGILKPPKLTDQQRTLKSPHAPLNP
jgi:hypothetical protein